MNWKGESVSCHCRPRSNLWTKSILNLFEKNNYIPRYNIPKMQDWVLFITLSIGSPFRYLLRKKAKAKPFKQKLQYNFTLNLLETFRLSEQKFAFNRSSLKQSVAFLCFNKKCLFLILGWPRWFSGLWGHLLLRANWAHVVGLRLLPVGEIQQNKYLWAQTGSLIKKY